MYILLYTKINILYLHSISRINHHTKCVYYQKESMRMLFLKLSHVINKTLELLLENFSFCPDGLFKYIVIKTGRATKFN